MYKYLICQDDNESTRCDEFDRVCVLIHDRLRLVETDGHLYTDSDGTKSRVFTHGESRFVVYDDYELNKVYVLSDKFLPFLYKYEVNDL